MSSDQQFKLQKKVTEIIPQIGGYCKGDVHLLRKSPNSPLEKPDDKDCSIGYPGEFQDHHRIFVPLVKKNSINQNTN